MIWRHVKTHLITLLGLMVSAAAWAQPAQPNTVSRTPVTWLIFVDDLHLDFRNTGRIRDAMRTMVKELIQDGDNFAIASAGPSGLAVDLTGDRQALDAAIKKATGNGLKYEDILNGPSGAAEVRYRVATAIATAQSILDNVPRATDRPTALLYFSNGYSFDLLPDRPSASWPSGQGRDVTRAEIQEQLTTLTATAVSTAVRIFAIDPRSVYSEPIPISADAEWQAHQAQMQRSLRAIADISGGFAIVSDFVTQLRHVANAMQR